MDCEENDEFDLRNTQTSRKGEKQTQTENKDEGKTPLNTITNNKRAWWGFVFFMLSGRFFTNMEGTIIAFFILFLVMFLSVYLSKIAGLRTLIFIITLEYMFELLCQQGGMNTENTNEKSSFMKKKFGYAIVWTGFILLLIDFYIVPGIISLNHWN